MEDAIYDSRGTRRFVGVDLREKLHRATTLLKFRRLLETHPFTKSIFDTINHRLAEKGPLREESGRNSGTVVPRKKSGQMHVWNVRLKGDFQRDH